MTKAWQVYYYAAFGAFGGLTAWLLVGLVNSAAWNVHLANLFVGAGIGLVVGGALGIVEGLLVRRSALWAALGLVGGAVAGMLSGMIGLLLGGLVFIWIEGGLLARVLGWILFGVFLGAGLGVVRLSFRRSLYGVVGGALGGLVGGVMYEVFTRLFLNWGGSVQMVLAAFGLALIGLILGVMIPLSATILSRLRSERGLIVYLNGPRLGTEIELIGQSSLGSSDACEVYIPDRRVERRQAEIHLGAEGFQIVNIGTLQPFFVNAVLVPPGRDIPLPDGARIQVGEITLSFQAG